MLSIPPTARILIYSQPVDMRQSFDGLAGIVHNVLKQDSFSGHFFIFFSRCKRRIKILQWDRDGYAIFYKRLEKGSYDISKWIDQAKGNSIEVDPIHFAMLMAGIHFKETVRQKRYSRESLVKKLEELGVTDSRGYVSSTSR